ncbi:MAG: hypothetical protein Q9208_001829 [Pyrenodesmia sp. 3 TL-2023]
MHAQGGEMLLRIALFSKVLQIRPRRGLDGTLTERRHYLAATLRATRKKGVVPVYISLAWFMFSLALSIEDAFGKIGDNQTAHNLALGLLLAWLPCFLIATIVDRNPVGADRIRRKLNEFLEDTRVALLDSEVRRSFLRDSGRNEVDLALISLPEMDDLYRDGFFTRFAGQGRTRWHYGVAHPILAAMEGKDVAASVRGWLANTNDARAAIIWGPVKDQGLIWFDPRMAWQISGSLIVVGSTVFGAFIISYFTPTVGLGCRSGGFMIFFILALSSFTLEMLIWWWIPEATKTPQWLRRLGARTLPYDFERQLSRADSSKWEWLTTGYVDFQTYDYYAGKGEESLRRLWRYAKPSPPDVQYYWAFGMALSVIVMTLTIVYITFEYTTQSHLSSEDYGQAMQGLRMTRWFRRRLAGIQDLPDALIRYLKRLLHRIVGEKVSPRRRSAVPTPRTRGRRPTSRASGRQKNPPSQPSEPPLFEDIEMGRLGSSHLEVSASRDGRLSNHSPSSGEGSTRTSQGLLRSD